ncbi:MAG: DUF1922 domain-containing protein [Candidatus Bathyarchaeia archaeon]|nr:DUF1922 domain-containing protein [Candidatus Bathyarchaeota archaeon]
MTSYVVVVCSKCGGYLLAKTDQKTRTCPYCSSKILMEKVQKVAAAKTAAEASVLLRRIKEKKARVQKPF